MVCSGLPGVGSLTDGFGDYFEGELGRERSELGVSYHCGEDSKGCKLRGGGSILMFRCGLLVLLRKEWQSVVGDLFTFASGKK